MNTPPSLQRCERLLTELVHTLVDQPHEVQVETVNTGRTTVFHIQVADVDVRRIIGRRGRTADALRVLFGNMAARSGRSYVLEVADSTRFQRPSAL